MQVPAAPLSLALLDSSPKRGAKGGMVRIRLGFHKNAGAYRNPSAAAAAAQLCIKRLYAVEDSYTR